MIMFGAVWRGRMSANRTWLPQKPPNTNAQMAIVAAAEGARAAVRVHEELQAEDRARALKR